MRIVLASKSPRRRQLIKNILNDVEYADSGADENLPGNISPEEAALLLAEKKAQSCLHKLDGSLGDDLTVIGCDTIVALDDKIYGKPKDAKEAFEILKKLSGTTHSVITGVQLLSPSKGADSFTEETLVTFADLTDEEIWDYIETGDPFDKAGAYGIQNVPEGFIEKISGDYNNVVGLPVDTLKDHLGHFLNED